MSDTFEAFPKIPRLFRDCVITEKIDGTNAAINIMQDEGGDMFVTCQSRKRIITPDDDNYGFATWVWDNLDALITTLGPGRHFGEWWGAGIQRRYDQTEKHFSLFNVNRWREVDLSAVPNLHTVPVLYEGAFDTYEADLCIESLEFNGSVAAPGFMDPEGVIVWHDAARQMFKVTVKDDEVPKALTKAAA